MLVTGDTGFKGAWLCWWLLQMGAEVSGAALPAARACDLYHVLDLSRHVNHVDVDLRDAAKIRDIMNTIKPQVVFHLAAQALVRESYKDPLGTFSSNVQGTAHVLESVRSLEDECSVVVVTSDKCYLNREWVYGYRESDPVGGNDPYSASKGCAEILTNAWRRSFFGPGSNVRVATARAGNVIGPGDWAEDRIIPDFMRAVTGDQPLHIRNPGAVRPWQHVLEPLSGYLQLGVFLGRPDGEEFAEAWNFGPRSGEVYTVKSLVESMAEHYGKGCWKISSVGSEQKEAGLLALSIDKAMVRLGWKPVWGFDETVRRTAEGYLRLQEASRMPEAAPEILTGQILDYIRDAQAAGISWTVDGALFPA